MTKNQGMEPGPVPKHYQTMLLLAMIHDVGVDGDGDMKVMTMIMEVMKSHSNYHDDDDFKNDLLRIQRRR